MGSSPNMNVYLQFYSFTSYRFSPCTTIRPVPLYCRLLLVLGSPSASQRRRPFGHHMTREDTMDSFKSRTRVHLLPQQLWLVCVS